MGVTIRAIESLEMTRVFATSHVALSMPKGLKSYPKRPFGLFSYLLAIFLYG